MNLPHPIPYQGSKRNLAKEIIPYIPDEIDRLVEPFAGSAAMSVAAAYYNKTQNIWLNELNKPLGNLIDLIIENPEYVSDEYTILWHAQLENPKEYYLKIRDQFNESQNPILLLYLLVRCVKNAVRYNESGMFNQSADNRRLGRRPEKMQKELMDFSNLLKGKVKVTTEDYFDIIYDLTERDWVYMDPPYMGTIGSSKRYIKGLNLEKFIESLMYLSQKNIPYIISFDGKTGNKVYGEDLPENLNLKKLLIKAGRSSQSTLNGKKDVTYESLYISQDALKRIEPNHILKKNSEQLTLDL